MPLKLRFSTVQPDVGRIRVRTEHGPGDHVLEENLLQRPLVHRLDDVFHAQYRFLKPLDIFETVKPRLNA